MKSLLQILDDCRTYLARHGVARARVEAELLLAHALGMADRLRLYLQFDRPLTESELARLRPLLRRRAQGEPLQYITGSAAFRNLKLQVGPGVLVPRPETESLIDLALAAELPAGDVLDLCTGSGAILLALATELRDKTSRHFVGTDLSPAALQWATRNLAAIAPGNPRISLLHGDLFAPVAKRRFALITANPPYVAPADYAALPRDVREHEPRQALWAGDDGMAFINAICRQAPAFLLPGGWLMLEIGETQASRAGTALADAGFRAVTVHVDLPGRDRFVAGRLDADV